MKALATRSRSASLAGRSGLAALIGAAALLGLPAFAAAANGDPIASGSINLKRTASFNGRLKANGVQMKPKALWLRGGDVDPATGAADLRLGKVSFRKGDRKVVYGNLKATLGRKGIIRGSKGKLFRLRGGSVVRSGFGATVSGIKVRLLKGAARKINRKLGLGSLHRAPAGTLSLSYIPRTVRALSGTILLRESIAAGTTGLKLFHHCVSAAPPGVSAIAPTTATSAIPPVFTLPIIGGTISPAGVDGVLQVGGGLRITKNNGAFTPGGCSAMPAAALELTDFAVDLRQLNIQASRTVTVAPPGVLGGARGSAVAYSIDPRDVTVTADPGARTIAYTEARVAINPITAGTLNEVFPLPSGGNPVNNFAEGDFFATADLILNVR